MEVTRTEQSQSPTAGRVSITSRWTTRDSTASSRTAQHSCICLSAESDLKCKVSTPFHQPGPSAQNQPRRTNRRRSQLTRRDPCRQQVGIEDAPAHAHRAGSASQTQRSPAPEQSATHPAPCPEVFSSPPCSAWLRPSFSCLRGSAGPLEPACSNAGPPAPADRPLAGLQTSPPAAPKPPCGSSPALDAR